CLYKLGCKGPETYNNCPSLEFNNVGGGVWPIGVGHPCFGCSEQGTGFHKALFSLSDVKTHTPPNAFPTIDAREGASSATVATAAVAGVAVGAALGASAVAGRKLGNRDADQE
ncbi:MAG: hydrogenase 2 small subunit, partial [Gammaproteobacteria bacterium]|nr:hydrogenase 2 small subunit [Gammaproteobacteria bacterium]